MKALLSSLSRPVLRLMPLLLMALVAGSTFWLVQVNSPSERDNKPREKTHTPDYFMDNFSSTELDVTGTTKYRFTGTKLLHFEDDQTYDVTRPALRAFAPDRPPVTGNADTGKMNAEGTIIDLYGKAFIVRSQGPDAAKDPRMTAASEYFQILINDDIVKTDKAVELTRGPSVMTANGLIFNNVTREVQLLGNVHGTIVSAPRNAGAPKQ